MALNKTYLNAGRNSASDECMTPFYAVDPLKKYIPKGKKIWCPFDKAWSAFVQILKKDNIVLYSHIDEGQSVCVVKLANLHFAIFRKAKMLK